MKEFTLILTTRNKDVLGIINNADMSTFTHNRNFNSAQEMSVDVYETMDGFTDPMFEKLLPLRLIYIPQLKEYYEIDVQYDDSISPKKTVTGTSLCEAELSQVYLNDIQINTEEDIERDDYEVTVFYNPSNPKASLLHRVLDKMPHYSIGTVEDAIKNKQRTFAISGSSIYDFLTGDCATDFNCLFVFDSVERKISAYSLDDVCNECGERGVFTHGICTKCGSKNISSYGPDMGIFVDVENLTDEVQFITEKDQIKTCFKLSAGDDILTAAVVGLNPAGSDYIYYFHDSVREDMSDELRSKLDSYDELYAEKKEQYGALSEENGKLTDDILFIQSTMMPVVSACRGEVSVTSDLPTDAIVGEIYKCTADSTYYICKKSGSNKVWTALVTEDIPTAQSEATKLQTQLTKVSLSKLTSSTSKSTVESAIKNYIKVIIKTGYVTATIETGTYDYIGTDDDGNPYGEWVGTFKVKNNSEEDDEVTTSSIRVRIDSDYDNFINEQILVRLNLSDNEDVGSIYDPLKIKKSTTEAEYAAVREAVELYCINRVISFRDAFQAALLIIEDGLSDSELATDFYQTERDKYATKVTICNEVIDEKDTVKSDKENALYNNQQSQAEIQQALNIKTYLGDDLYKEFCAFRREDSYQNSNYTSEGLDNAEIYERARDYLEQANQELLKAGTPQHKISCTLYDLLQIKEFANVKDNFEVGAWLYVRVGKDVYRLRLLSYSESGSDDTAISVEFSDVIYAGGVMSDIQSVLSQAQSMATSYSSVQRQAAVGSDAYETIFNAVEEGLDAAIVNIKSNNNEEIILNSNGLFARTWDSLTEEFDDEQLRITHNILAYTDDGWKTVKAALGKHTFKRYNDSHQLVTETGYGLTAQFVTSGQINGSQIIGGKLYSENYTSSSGTFLDLNNGEFSLAGGAIKYMGGSLEIDVGGTVESDVVDSVPIYFCSSSDSIPVAPSACVTLNSDKAYEVWNLSYATKTDECKYYFTCNQTTKKDEDGELTYTFSSPVIAPENNSGVCAADVASLHTQLEITNNSLSTCIKTNDTNEIVAALKLDANSGINAIAKEMNINASQVTIGGQSLDSVVGNNSENINSIMTYMFYDADRDNPVGGKGEFLFTAEDKKMSIGICSGQISFYDGGLDTSNIVAYISGGKLKISSGIFVDTLQIGGFEFSMHDGDTSGSSMSIKRVNNE